MISAVWLGAMAVVCADEGGADKSTEARQNLEIRRRFAELSRKVNELPEVQALKAEVEKAQAAYAEAFEAALAREDPEILKQYRSVFEARIVRLQEKKAQVDGAPGAASEGGQNADGQKRIAEAQRKAMLAPGVQEALKKWSSATSEAERTAAKATYSEILRKAMLEVDPSLKPVLSESVGVPTATPEPPAAK